MTGKFICLLCILIMVSCKKGEVIAPDTNSEQTTIKLTVDGKERSFLLYKPQGYNNAGKMSLIFVNHGGQGNPESMLKLADFRVVADKEKIILIYPLGVQNSWNDGRPTTANQLGIDDVNFFRQMCNYAVSNLSVDNAKIYVTGLSNGGFMASRLGCELSDRIAAIAVVGASMGQTVFNSCAPTKSIPSIIIQGTLDTFVPFNGGVVAPGAGGIAVSHNEAIAKLVRVNSCSTTPAVSALPNIANDGTTITESKYSNATTKVEVISYRVNNGGHTWPQGLQYLPENIIGKTSQDMNANEVIWEFFKRFSRN